MRILTLTHMTTTTVTTKDQLYRAKRDLEKAVDSLQDVVRPLYRDESLPSYYPPAADDVLYFSPQANNRKSFRKLFSALLAFAPAEHQTILLGHDAVISSLYDTVETLAAAEKARLAEKRTKVAAARATREELNLAEGVSLKGVDVGQYKVILAGLEPVRKHAESTYANQYRDEFTGLSAKLEVHGWNYKAAFSFDTPRGKRLELPENFSLYFNSAVSSPGICHTRLDCSQRIANEAKKRALAYVQGYAAKLSVKVGEEIANDPVLADTVPTACSVSSGNLWSDSVARITLKGALIKTEVTFHTRMIWNRSHLGTIFNQWPTRRIN